MEYGILDRLFYKPLFLLGANVITWGFLSTDYPGHKFLFLFIVICSYVVIISLRVFNNPKTIKLHNFRNSEIKDPISKIKTLLSSEFFCWDCDSSKVAGRKEYGNGRIFWVAFELYEVSSGIEAKIHCNSPIPENLWRLSEAQNSIVMAATSVGYRPATQ